MRLFLMIMLLLVAGFTVPVHAEPSAPVFAYFQIGEDAEPGDNIRLDQFKEELRLIERDQVTVMPLSAIVAAMAEKRDLPDRAIGISFDEAYSSVGENALPLLSEAKLPATIFVTPQRVERGGEYMSWDDLRAAVKQGFSIGAKIDLDSLEDDSPVKTIAAINESVSRIETEIGVTPTLFSYADGIADQTMRDSVKSRGFVAAFGLQSGSISDKSNPYMLPRFPMTEAFGTIDRFHTAVNSLPLEVQDVLPADPSILTGANPPQIGFSVVSEDVALTGLACFVESQGKAPMEIIGTRVELRPVQPFDTEDTTRINCTAPGSGDYAGRWYWLGFNYYVPAP